MLIREGNIYDAFEIASVQVKSWQTTYHGIISDDYLRDLDIQERARKWEDLLTNSDQKVFVATEGENIIGFATCGKCEEFEGYDSTLSSIYLLSEYQGNGIGKELFGNCGQYLKSLGYQSMYIGVLSNNPAKKFYEKMDGKFIMKKQIEIGGEFLVEELYGWSL